MELVWNIEPIGVPDNENCIMAWISAPSILVRRFDCSEESTDYSYSSIKNCENFKFCDI